MSHESASATAAPQVLRVASRRSWSFGRRAHPAQLPPKEVSEVSRSLTIVATSRCRLRAALFCQSSLARTSSADRRQSQSGSLTIKTIQLSFANQLRSESIKRRTATTTYWHVNVSVSTDDIISGGHLNALQNDNHTHRLE